MDSNIKKQLLRTWHHRAARASLGHYAQAEVSQKNNSYLTAFNLLSGIFVLYLVNTKSFDPNLLILSFCSLTVVLTTALQYVLKLEERSYDHKAAGNEFSAIKRKIELLFASEHVSESCLTEVVSDYNHTAKNHHIVRRSTWMRIEKQFIENAKEDRKLLSFAYEPDQSSELSNTVTPKKTSPREPKIFIE